MTSIMMNRFGRTLTDRPDGQKAYKTILAEQSGPYILNFAGVMSMGSSFGDEVVVKLAQAQNNKIKVINANDGISACIKRVIEGTDITVGLG